MVSLFKKKSKNKDNKKGKGGKNDLPPLPENLLPMGEPQNDISQSGNMQQNPMGDSGQSQANFDNNPEMPSGLSSDMSPPERPPELDSVTQPPDMSSDLPAPGDYPEQEQEEQQNQNQLSSQNTVDNNTHDQIPDDSVLGASNTQNDQAGNIPEPDIPNPDNYGEIPKDVGMQGKQSQQTKSNVNQQSEEQSDFGDVPQPSPMEDLPEVPDVSSKSNSQEQANVGSDNQQPSPDVDDVPLPPPIFSDESFYETPDEVKHLLDKKKQNQDLSEKTVLSESSAGKKVSSSSSDYGVMEAPGKSRAGIGEESNEISRKGPVFIDINSFQTMLNDIDSIKTTLKSSGDVLTNLEDIKESKERELESWKNSLKDIQKKISYVDKLLFSEA